MPLGRDHRSAGRALPGRRDPRQGTGRIILELCDGHFSLAEIVQKLETQFMLAPKEKIRADVLTFLEQLHAKRIIDY